MIIDELEVTLFEVISVIAKSYRNGKYCSSAGGMKRAIDGAEIALNLYTSPYTFFFLHTGWINICVDAQYH